MKVKRRWEKLPISPIVANNEYLVNKYSWS